MGGKFKQLAALALPEIPKLFAVLDVEATIASQRAVPVLQEFYRMPVDRSSLRQMGPLLACLK
eukprot:3865856-Karenia_brevis.AAC.1